MQGADPGKGAVSREKGRNFTGERNMGWYVPPPKKPEKDKARFSRERRAKVKWLILEGFLRSHPIAAAILKVRREDFTLEGYRDYCYEELPLPIPGENATISCPHSYPLFYEALQLEEGDTFLEIGSGSGYGAALAREVVGAKGKVFTMEIDKKTFEFARRNLTGSGYEDVLIIQGDGSLGYPPLAPYDKICVTAACPDIPRPLIDQLRPGGKLIAPVGRPQPAQDLILLEKNTDGALKTQSIEQVLYVPLRGKYGWSGRS